MPAHRPRKRVGGSLSLVRSRLKPTSSWTELPSAHLLRACLGTGSGHQTDLEAGSAIGPIHACIPRSFSVRRIDRLAEGWSSVKSPLSRREVERRRVDAIPHAGRAWAVREEVAEVRATIAACDLGAPHPEGAILSSRDVSLFDDVVEAWPTRPRLELRPRVEERFPADDAAVGSRTVVIPVRSAERRLRARLLSHRVLDRTELAATILVLWMARQFRSPFREIRVT